MMTTTVPVKLDPQNLYGAEEYQEGLNLAIQNGSVYSVVKSGGMVNVLMLSGLFPEDL